MSRKQPKTLLANSQVNSAQNEGFALSEPVGSISNERIKPITEVLAKLPHPGEKIDVRIGGKKYVTRIDKDNLQCGRN